MRLRLHLSRGIVLVSVMFLAVLVAMYVLSSTILSRGQLGFLKQTRETQLAEAAARSGIEYALTRLQENPEWRGEEEAVVVDTSGLVVVEGGGNVVGLIRNGDGGTAQFRLRFNHQDGASGGDDLDDPPSHLRFDSPHISGNNLLGLADEPFYLGDGPEGQASTRLPYDVPAGMVALVCEGRVASELESASAADPNPPVERLEAARVLEEFHQIESLNGSEQVVSAVSMAGKRVLGHLFDGGRVYLGDVTGGEAKMRAKQQVRLNDGSGVITGPDGEVRVGNGSPNADLQGGVTAGEEDVNSAFYQVAWDQVKEPREGAGELPAGVYVFWANEGLRYYDMTLPEYRRRLIEEPGFVHNSGAPAPLPEGMAFVPAGETGPDGEESSRHRFVVTDDILVTSTSNSSDLTIMPRRGAREKVLPDPGDGDGGAGDMQAEAYQPDDEEFWTGAASYLGISNEMNPNTVVESLIANEDFLGNWNEAEGAGTPFSEAPIHHFLKALAQGGNLNYTSPEGESGEISWNPGGELNDNNAKEVALTAFLKGQAEVTGVTNPNPNFLENVPGQGPDVYRFRSSNVSALFFGGGNTGQGDLEEIDLAALGVSGEDLNLGPQDFELDFAPQDSEGVRFQAPGNVHIATDVRGQGASIKANGDIRVVGVGMQLDAGSGEDAPRVSLYAKGDIVLSTLRLGSDGEYAFEGLDLRGVLYSWRNIVLRTADQERTAPGIYLQGSMVAYGGDPASQSPGQGEGGNIRLMAQNVDLMFDPHYLAGLSGAEGLSATLVPVSTSYR